MLSQHRAGASSCHQARWRAASLPLRLSAALVLEMMVFFMIMKPCREELSS